MWFRRYWFPVPVIFVALGFWLGSGPLVGLGAFMLLAGFVARKWSDYTLVRLRYERRLPENRAFPGDSLEMTLRLTNDKVLPIPWVELRDLISADLPVGEERLSPSGSPGQVYLHRSGHLSWYERLNWPVALKAPARGYYRLGPGRLTTSDIFGFFPVEREEETRDAVIVYPRTYTMPELGLSPDRPFGERKGRQRIFEDPARFAGLRDYRPEDSLRRIDWKASARRQSLQSRVYEPSSTLHLLVAVNAHTLAHSWQGFIPETFERILSVAASVARYGFETGYAVGLVANGSYPTSDRPMRIPVGRHPDQLMRILEALAVIGPLTLSYLPAVIEREAQAFPFGATMVCVTARMDDDLAAALGRVHHAGHGVTVLSLADADFDPPLRDIPVLNVSNAVRSQELRSAVGATG
jgi:uncharacterized protein (DUF58 family)